MNSTQTFADFCIILEDIRNDSVLVSVREKLKNFIEYFQKQKTPNELSKQVYNFCLNVFAQRAVAFEEQVSLIRELLADIYESEEDWVSAAVVLKGISLHSGFHLAN